MINFGLCSCVRSKVLPAKVGGADLVEFRGQHDDVWELFEAVECTSGCGEHSD